MCRHFSCYGNIQILPTIWQMHERLISNRLLYIKICIKWSMHHDSPEHKWQETHLAHLSKAAICAAHFCLLHQDVSPVGEQPTIVMKLQIKLHTLVNLILEESEYKRICSSFSLLVPSCKCCIYSEGLAKKHPLDYWMNLKAMCEYDVISITTKHTIRTRQTW